VINLQETVFTHLLFVLILALALKILVILFKDALTLLNMTTKLSDNKTNVTYILVTFALEILLKLQFFAVITIFAQPILAMLKLDVFSLLLFAKVLINVSHLLAIKQLENVL